MQAVWLGHATVLVQLGGLTLLTDPIFSERCSPVQFLGPRCLLLRRLAYVSLQPVQNLQVFWHDYLGESKAGVISGKNTPAEMPCCTKQTQ